MQETSALYRQIMSATEHWFEARLVVGEGGDLVTEHGEIILFGNTAIVVSRTGPDSGFAENQIFSIETSNHMFDNAPEIGKAVAGEIDVKMLRPSGDMPRMSVVIPYIRACAYINDEELQSEWLQQGAYYIDTREISNNDDGITTLSFHGYDAMLKAEQDYAKTNMNWPALDKDIVKEIASFMGVSVDPRTLTLMNLGYRFPLPTGYTMREMLGFIAGAYGGSFIMSDIGELRLVTLWELPAETRLLTDEAGYRLVFGEDRIKV